MIPFIRFAKWLPWLLVLVMSIVLFRHYIVSKDTDNQRETTHHLVLEQIENLGKLELLRYSFKDIVEHEVKKQWLPNARVLLIVEGEAVGCINLSLIDSTDIVTDSANVLIYLPEPEICYYKIDHRKSRVYNTEYTLMEEAKLVDEAYRNAENQLLTAALKSDLLQKTKVSAEKILHPLLAKITNKNILLRYRQKAYLPTPK